MTYLEVENFMERLSFNKWAVQKFNTESLKKPNDVEVKEQ